MRYATHIGLGVSNNISGDYTVASIQGATYEEAAVLANIGASWNTSHVGTYRSGRIYVPIDKWPAAYTYLELIGMPCSFLPAFMASGYVKSKWIELYPDMADQINDIGEHITYDT